MESRRFLRSLAEARRRYGGILCPDDETIDCHPQPPWAPLDLRPRVARRPAQEPTE